MTEWLTNLMGVETEQQIVFLPEIADYELRRKLLHLMERGATGQRSVDRLDRLTKKLQYLPLTTAVMRRAAEMWAWARSRGLPTAPEHFLDGDVILAAQVESVGGVAVTENPRHLSRFVAAEIWSNITPTFD